MTLASITLPFPPSVNNLFPGKHSRHKSKRYKAWIKEAGLTILTQEPIHRFRSPVSIVLTFGRPDKRRRDISNFVKPVEDLLVTHGIIRDDSDVHRGEQYWDATVTGVRVEITEAGGVA